FEGCGAMIVKSGPVTGPSTVIVIGMPSPTQPKPTWTVVDALTVMWYFPSPVRLVAITVIVVVLVPPATSIGYVGVKSIVGCGGTEGDGRVHVSGEAVYACEIDCCLLCPCKARREGQR